MQSVITLANEHWAKRPELWSTDKAGADAPAFSYAVDSDPETTPTQSYTIMDTVIDPETGVNIACIVDTGCGPPSIIEKRLVQKTQPKLLETLEPVTTDTFGVGGNKLPVLGTIKNYRFIHNNRECHTDALVVDVDLGSCSLILGMPFLASVEAQIFCHKGTMAYQARSDDGNLETRMFGRGIVTRTPLLTDPAKSTVQLAATTRIVGLDYALNDNDSLRSAIYRITESYKGYWAHQADYHHWACQVTMATYTNGSINNERERVQLTKQADDSQRLHQLACYQHRDGGRHQIDGGEGQVLQMKIQKSAVPTASTSSLNWERSDKKNVHWAQERHDPHRLSQYPQQHQRYQTYLPEHGDEHASGPDDAPMNEGRTIGRIGCTKHPNRAESLRSGRTSSMVAPVGALDERQTPVQWALSEAVRDFILHSRAVGKGQPRSYDDPQRKGSYLLRTTGPLDYSHYRQFVLKTARSATYQAMYRQVHGRHMKWLAQVGGASAKDFQTAYDTSSLGDLSNGVDRTEQTIEQDLRQPSTCKCGFPAEKCQCYNPRKCQQRAQEKWPAPPLPLLKGMDEEWELLTKESEPKTDILQDFVDGMDGSDAKTEKDPHLGKPDQHQMSLVDSKVHMLFMQADDRVLRVTQSDPGMSSRLLKAIPIERVGVRLVESEEMAEALTQLETKGASLAVEDTVRYPGLVGRLADDGQSMALYLGPRANEWLDHYESSQDISDQVLATQKPMTPTAVPEGVDTTTPTDTTELTKADTNDVHENLSFPTATPEIIKAISTDYEGPSTKYGPNPVEYMKKLVEDAGIVRQKFVHDPSKWDLENPMNIELREGEEPPPPEYRRMGPNMLAICAEQLKEFLKAGWIYRGAARTAAPVLMVRKPNADATADVKWRVTIDYRKLNNVIRKKAMDLPTCTGTIHTIREQACESYRQVIANKNGTRTSIHTDHSDRMAPSLDPGRSFLTVTDIVKAFHRVCVTPEAQELTAFCVPGLGVFKWSVAPMGLATSPAEYVEWFTKKMKRYGVLYRPGDHEPSEVLDIPELNITDGEPSPQQYCQVYIDDIILVACDIDEAVRQVKHMVRILELEKLYISLEKTVFATTWLRFLGYIIGHTDTFADPRKVEAIQGIMPCTKEHPWSKTATKSFAGMTVYYRMFVMDYAKLMRPIHRLVRDDVTPDSNVSAFWTRRLPKADPNYETEIENALGQRSPRVKEGSAYELTTQEGFEEVKRRLSQYILGRQPDPRKPFTIATDASQYAAAGALCQEHKGKMVPLEFFSKAFNKEAQRYTATERECLAIKLALENWSWYLLGSEFKVVLYSDHQALQALDKSKINNTRISNWQIALSPYRFTVQYKPGRSAIMAGPDCLSRLLQDNWMHQNDQDSS